VLAIFTPEDCSGLEFVVIMEPRPGQSGGSARAPCGRQATHLDFFVRAITVSGIVTNGATGAPIAGDTVQVSLQPVAYRCVLNFLICRGTPSADRAVTDAGGRYRLSFEGVFAPENCDGMQYAVTAYPGTYFGAEYDFPCGHSTAEINFPVLPR
jgi:hypothetical protein